MSRFFVDEEIRGLERVARTGDDGALERLSRELVRIAPFQEQLEQLEAGLLSAGAVRGRSLMSVDKVRNAARRLATTPSCTSAEFELIYGYGERFFALWSTESQILVGGGQCRPDGFQDVERAFTSQERVLLSTFETTACLKLYGPPPTHPALARFEELMSLLELLQHVITGWLGETPRLETMAAQLGVPIQVVRERLERGSAWLSQSRHADRFERLGVSLIATLPRLAVLA